MGELVLVTGGARSGKSSFALERCNSLPGRRCFIATCPITDGEMANRIEAHRLERAGQGWYAIEEQHDFVDQLSSEAGWDVILIDCLTLWVNNLMYRAEQQKTIFTDAHMALATEQLVLAARKCPADVWCVTNEVGLGIVPDNAAARHYRDLVGRCNRTVAEHADEVFMVSCGIPLPIKSLSRKLS